MCTEPNVVTRESYVCVATFCVLAVLSVLICCILDAGLLARCQYPEGPATDHLDTGFYG
jgi:hypothetical protein